MQTSILADQALPGRHVLERRRARGLHMQQPAARRLPARTREVGAPRSATDRLRDIMRGRGFRDSIPYAVALCSSQPRRQNSEILEQALLSVTEGLSQAVTFQLDCVVSLKLGNELV